MTPQGILDACRIGLSDVAEPRLWSDDELFRYFVKAQDDMVKAMGGFADHTTSAICTLALSADAPLTPISPYILRIRSGRLATGARDVIFASEGDLRNMSTWDYGVITRGLSLSDTDTGNVTHGILGVQENHVRWYKVPADDDTCTLHVFRLPYPRPVDWDDAAIELVEDHHESLLIGMYAQAYLKQDAEAFDKDAAARHKSAFDVYCGKLRQDIERRRYRPRSVQYGGL